MDKLGTHFSERGLDVGLTLREMDGGREYGIRIRFDFGRSSLQTLYIKRPKIGNTDLLLRLFIPKYVPSIKGHVWSQHTVTFTRGRVSIRLGTYYSVGVLDLPSVKGSVCPNRMVGILEPVIVVIGEEFGTVPRFTRHFTTLEMRLFEHCIQNVKGKMSVPLTLVSLLQCIVDSPP